MFRRSTLHSPAEIRFGAILLLGMGLGCEASVVNLDGPAADRWFAGNAVAVGQNTGPTTLYRGRGFPQTYAVDETTLYVFLAYELSDSEALLSLKACDLVACAATVRTLYDLQFAKDDAIIAESLVLSEDDVDFALRQNLSDTVSIKTCPKMGCGTGPREIYSVPSGVLRLAVKDQFVYWTDQSPMTFNRCPSAVCTQPDSRPLQGDMNTYIVIDDGLPFVVAGDYAYATTNLTVQRVRLDLSADPELIYQSKVPLAGIGVAGDWVYFAVSTLAGELRRCPVSGCAGAPEVVASGQRWPWSILVDTRKAYWSDLGNPDAYSGGSVIVAPLDGSSGPQALAPDLQLYPGWQLAMNSHHLYWLEGSSNGDGLSGIRTLAK